MFECEKKDVGKISSVKVFETLPEAMFNLCQISVNDPRLDGPAQRYVWALEMSADEWNKLYQAIFPQGGKR